MRKLLNKIKKEEKGSISTVVFFTIMMFITILMATYFSVTINAKSQLQSDIKIQEIYSREAEQLDEIYIETTQQDWSKTKKVNKPKVLTGMKPIKFSMPTDNEMGHAIETYEEDESWYNYGKMDESKKWANTETEDGSMWVWIPRFAYKITNGEVDIKFLIGTTDFYLNEKGKLENISEKGYTKHSALTNESGIWVSKFEAGYARGNNDIWRKDSTEEYSTSTTNFYGSNQSKIQYPVFRPITYSFNYISDTDAYKIASALNSTDNIYGLTTSDSKSHLITNDEWHAVELLSRSIYGNDNEVKINNANLNNTADSVYGVTGCTSQSSTSEVNITIAEINQITQNTPNRGIYIWNQRDGQASSTTRNIYGIYDMRGGHAEITADSSSGPFYARGGSYSSSSGISQNEDNFNGSPDKKVGFRAVLVSK